MERRFVILEHDWPELHWDLMIEESGRLLTWRILEQPQIDRDLLIEESHDHRIDYLDYSGPISNNRGHVFRWDSGEVQSMTKGDQSLKATIHSQRFGRVVSVNIENGSLHLKDYFSDS